jgi:hypothetical protein
VVTVHQTIGTLVLIAFLVLTVVNVLRLTGRQITGARQLSFGAAGLLLLQYVLGFSLLGDDHSVSAWHILFALSALVTVGVEHAIGNPRPPETAGNTRIAAAATAGTTLLVLVAYAIGSSS